VTWETVFAEIEQLLVSLIPRRVQELAIPIPVYCLMIEYYSSSVAGDVVPTLKLPSVAFRSRVQSARGKESPHYFWSPPELPACADIFTASLQDESLLAKVRAHSNLVSRKMARAVARRLNNLDWTRIAPVSDGFVVVAADATQTFGDLYGDIKASIGEARWNDLIARRLLGAAEASRLD
jgi:hypothetical protein